jgi:two-component system sensor histidine kinase PilS (NtrC family)
MSGSIQVLREELPLSAEQAQLMDIVLRESERLNQTIRSFLDYARPQRSTITRIDVGAAVRDTALLLRNRTGGGEGHVVEIDVPPDPVWLDADENQVRQVVWNLATNGLRAMAGGGRLRLSARHVDTAAGGEVLVTVSDEGCGIPADQIEGIFQPFRSSFERGTGLGLAIVHRIVTESQGTIDVSSTVGEGTTIRVHLPSRERLAEAADAPVPVRMSA